MEESLTNGQNQENSLSIDELTMLLGQKDLEIYMLKKQVGQLQQQVKNK